MAFQVHNDDEVKALFKQVQGEVPGSPIFIMKLASQVRLFTFPSDLNALMSAWMISYSNIDMFWFLRADI